MEYRITDKNDIERLMNIRLEMLRIVNDLSDEYEYSQDFVESTRSYFLNGQQTTILALDENKTVGCATMAYIWIMPTFLHPTGKRAHLMNVYTSEAYRRQGIGNTMVKMLIEDAKEKGATEISLDATNMGRPLYEKLGFTASDECMVLKL